MASNKVEIVDLWKAKADLLDLYRKDYEHIRKLNYILAFSFGVSLILNSILAYNLWK